MLGSYIYCSCFGEFPLLTEHNHLGHILSRGKRCFYCSKTFLHMHPHLFISKPFFVLFGQKKNKTLLRIPLGYWTGTGSREKDIKSSSLSWVTADCRLLGTPAELISPYLSLRFRLWRTSPSLGCALFFVFAEPWSSQYFQWFTHYTIQPNKF